MSVKRLNYSGIIVFVLIVGVLADISRASEENFPMQKFDLPFLASFCNQWLLDCEPTDWCGGYDYNQSGEVNFIDFTWFCDRWMDDLWPKCWSCRTQCHGDADCDGDVDGADMIILQAAMPGAQYDPCADFNRDGQVNIEDFIIIRLWGPGSTVPPTCPMGGTWTPII